MSNRQFQPYQIDGPTGHLRGTWFILSVSFYLIYYRNSHLSYANYVDPDQRPHLTASDLGLHRLNIFHLWDAVHAWAIPFLVFYFVSLVCNSIEIWLSFKAIFSLSMMTTGTLKKNNSSFLCLLFQLQPSLKEKKPCC